jgi:uncharacterized protein (TIGR04255 family)
MVTRTGILPKSPLVLSLASVRYAPWPLIGKKIDEIHDGLRDILPLLQHFQVQTLGPTGAPQPESSSIWMLMSGDRSRGVQLTQDQMLITSRRYSRYSEFSTVIDRVLSALIPRMRFMDVTNLGVRYVDHVRVKDGDGLENYLCTGLLPPNFGGLERLGGSFSASYTTQGKELRVRCVAQAGAASIPEDLVPWLAMMQPPGRALELSPLKIGECTLDMDALEQHEEPLRFDGKEMILDKLNGLHEVANEFFRRDDVFTDHAFEFWKSEV